MKKNLSVFINFFKEIGTDYLKSKYTTINYGESITLNTVGFFNNLVNKDFILIFILLDNNNYFNIIGEKRIYSTESFIEKTTNPVSIGCFDGVFGDFSFKVEKNLNVGNYELCVVGKQINPNEDLKLLRESIKLNKSLDDFDNTFELYTSAPFNVLN